MTPTVYDCRVPTMYFPTTGYGDTDEGEGDNPAEAGSYDYALIAAGIAEFNSPAPWAGSTASATSS